METLAKPDPPGWIDWHANIYQNHYPLTGIDQQDRRQAADALDIALQGEQDLRSPSGDARRQHLIHPDWFPGRTLPQHYSTHAGLGNQHPYIEASDERHESLTLPGTLLTSLATAQERGVFSTATAPAIPPGRWTFHGIPFQLSPSPESPEEHGFLLNNGPPPRHERSSRPSRTRVTINKSAQALYFLHLAANASAHEVIARYHLTYQDGSRCEIPLISSARFSRAQTETPDCSVPNIHNWWTASTHHSGTHHRPVCVIDCDHQLGLTGYYYILRWPNPHPGGRIKTLEITAERQTKASLLLCGLTLATK
jgi:hypothetical protein